MTRRKETRSMVRPPLPFILRFQTINVWVYYNTSSSPPKHINKKKKKKNPSYLHVEGRKEGRKDTKLE
jgi:hypothetical protein